MRGTETKCITDASMMIDIMGTIETTYIMDTSLTIEVTKAIDIKEFSGS